MAPSTPPPPASCALAALTTASTSSVVMSATRTSRRVGVGLRLGRLLHVDARLGEMGDEFARLKHLADNVAAADEFAFDVKLRDRRPIGVFLDALAEVGVLENTDPFERRADVIEDLHDLAGKAAHRKLRRALHEQHDRVFGDFLFDLILHIGHWRNLVKSGGQGPAFTAKYRVVGGRPPAGSRSNARCDDADPLCFLSHLNPMSVAARLCDSVDRALDRQTLFEIDRDGLLAPHAADQRAAFDDFQIVEAKLMAGGDDETIIGLVRRTHQDRAEALVFRSALGEIHLHFVETLLIESDHAAAAENLHEDTAFAAPGAATDMDRAARAAGQP